MADTSSSGPSLLVFIPGAPLPLRAVIVDLGVDGGQAALDLRKLALDRYPMCFEQGNALELGVLPLADQVHLTANIPDRHPGGRQPPDELDASHITFAEAAPAGPVLLDRIEQFGPLVVTQRVSRYPVAAATSEMLSGITRKRYDLERAPSQAGELWQNKARRS